jgi:hypothetical protein
MYFAVSGSDDCDLHNLVYQTGCIKSCTILFTIITLSKDANIFNTLGLIRPNYRGAT